MRRDETPERRISGMTQCYPIGSLFWRLKYEEEEEIPPYWEVLLRQRQTKKEECCDEVRQGCEEAHAETGWA